MSILNEDQLLGAPAGSSQYQIQRSLRFNSADSAYLSRTPASAGNRKTWTWSGWVKRAQIAGTNWIFSAGNIDTTQLRFTFLSTDALTVDDYASSAYQLQLITTQLFRDPSAWYHIVLSVDTTQATAANRVKLYVNGSQITTFSTSTYYSQNYDTQVNTASLPHRLGAAASTTAGSVSASLNAYLADIHFIDGQALTPASFGETNAVTGRWEPKAYTGTYGTNGFKLDFADNSAATAAALGKDTSGNGNNWTPNNLSVTAGAGNDSLVDTPTSSGTDTGAGGEVRGNYCTLNPLARVVSTATPTISEGNLKIVPGGSGDNYYVGTQALTGGKFYYEVTVDSVGGGVLIGVCPASAYTTTGGTPGTYRNTGAITDFSGTNTTAGSTFTTGDVIGVAVDIDAGTVKFYKNNVGQGATPSISFTAGTPVVARGRFDAVSGALTFNFGQRPFAYTAPSGFKALCDTNLPAPTIVKPSTVMDVKLYTGNGSTQTISGLGFSPDLVWLKSRSSGYGSNLVDTVRGATNRLVSNATEAETPVANGLTAFTSDGFSLGNYTETNINTGSMVAWCWDAGSSTVTNTSGTIQSSVRANASAGFSIVTYTGTGANATVGHGLGVAPGLVIVKSRGANLVNWCVWHSSFAGTEYVLLSTTGAKTTDTTMWNSTAPSSSVISLGTNATVNQSTYNYVAYCFAPVAGYSAFGSYTGVSSADGPFVYTGFRPRWIMTKAVSGSTSNWAIIDTARDTRNPATLELGANLSVEENNVTEFLSVIDVLSNGFKFRDSNSESNATGITYIYAAFAEFPFQYARAR